MSENEKRIAMFRGRRADSLTREELLEAYEHAVAELERTRDFSRQDREMQALFEQARKMRGA